eukprot:7515845-Alexandrium_andersonii.AAC.1
MLLDLGRRLAELAMATAANCRSWPRRSRRVRRCLGTPGLPRHLRRVPLSRHRAPGEFPGRPRLRNGPLGF